MEINLKWQATVAGETLELEGQIKTSNPNPMDFTRNQLGQMIQDKILDTERETAARIRDMKAKAEEARQAALVSPVPVPAEIQPDSK